MRHLFSLISFIICFNAFSSFAQSTTTGSVKGFVYEKGNGEALSNVNIFVKEAKTGAQTDDNGYFSISQLLPSTYTLFATAFGYDTAFITVKIEVGNVVSKKFYLNAKGLELGGVDVSARKIQKTTRINIGTTTITPKEIKLLPSSGGEPDLAQYLQVTPGVTFTGDQGGQLYIRGGSPVQTGILLDGITIYNPFHSIGLYSVFETEAIRSADVYTAGFNATYGNRSSAILDIHTKDGNNQRLSGIVSLSPIMIRGMLEGPLLKQKTPDDGSATFLLSVKHSYLSQTSKVLYSGLGESFKNGLPFEFTDIYGKMSFSGNNGSKFNLFGFNFNDKANILNSAGVSTAQFDWASFGAGTTFVVSPSGSSSLINGKFAYSNYKINNQEVNFAPRSSSINNFEGAIDFTYFFSGYSQLKYGIEVAGQNTKLDYRNSLGNTIVLDRNNTTAAAFFLFKKNFNQRFILEPSIRLQYYSSLSKFSPEPRINMKFNVNSNLRFKAAAGLYSQNIVGIKSDRDVVNFFNGFVLSPDQQILNTNRERVDNNLERAQHLVAGVEFDIKDVEFNLEPWFKNFSQIIQLNRTKGVNTFNTAYDFQADKGVAAGIDFSAKYVIKRVFLWGVISYQKITYTTRLENFDNTYTSQDYPPPFDRRMNINLVGSYTLGKKKDWEISARFNYGSPFPFTQTQGFNENVNITGTSISGNPMTQNGNINTIYSNTINGGRLTQYHRLDMSLKKTFKISTYSSLETTFAMTNVYDRNNVFYVNRLDNKVYYQLPVFPSLNVSWRF
ncbi:MAG: carboxypeptidase-like regulatory domain-containing protein [Phycisphaerales bacterium]|nr:carboxypeptidase-like regulatory domain-containing protein [Phycisphaerales bacterium]